MHHTEKDNAQALGISNVLEYIHCNLSDNLTLEKIASVANYSPFHFQRMFLQKVGETPKQYIIRLRLERVAHFLKIFPDLSISELSFESGFASLSTFSRAFKNYFGVNPEEYRRTPSGQFSKICKTDDKKGKTNLVFHPDFWSQDFSQATIKDMKDRIQISIKKVTAAKLAFAATCLDTPDAVTDVFRKLCKWAEPRELITPETKFIGILLDIPFITPLEKCRYWACITIKDSFNSKKHGITEIPSGTYATYSYKGNIVSTIRSLGYFRHTWLENSGYEIKDVKGFEVYSENPAFKPAEQIKREIHIPVKPA
jgi:AraC family transcriptional regulator